MKREGIWLGFLVCLECCIGCIDCGIGVGLSIGRLGGICVLWGEGILVLGLFMFLFMLGNLV